MLESIKAYFANINLGLVFFGIAGLIVVVYAVLIIRSMVLARKDAAYFAIAEARRRDKMARREKRLQGVYNMAVKIPLTRGYMKKIEQTYLAICPYDAPQLVKIAAENLALTFIVSTVGVVAVLAFNLVLEKRVTLYSIACCLLVFYIAGIECANLKLKKTERKIMEDMIRYVSKVKHAYVSSRNIPLAVSQAAEGLGHEINRQSLILHDILSGTERRDKVREYALSPTTNKYMKLFIQQAYEVSESGDIIGADSESLFTKNLEFLRIEMKKDMYQKEKRLFRLEGYTFVCLFPIFFLTPLKSWGMTLAEDMKGFYEGPGQFIVLLSFLATVVIYDAINRAKEVVFQRSGGKVAGFDNVSPHSPIRKFMERIELGKGKRGDKIDKMLRDTGSRQSFGAFMLASMTYVIITAIVATVFFSLLHMKNKEQLLTEVNNMDSIVSIATENAKRTISGHILDMTNEYLHAEELSVAQLEADFNRRMYMPNREVGKRVAEEVYSRVVTCRGEHLKWYEFYIGLLVGVAASFLPYIGLKYRHRLVLQGKDDEVRQFQAIILMERMFPNITCVQILEEMENFARVFKPSLQACMNSYSAGPQEALYELRLAEKDCDEFVELIDGFIAVEKVGVATAFAEVAGNREMEQEIKELDEERHLERQRDLTSTMSKIPAVLAVGVYFIAPFAINVISRLFVMFEMLEGFS